MTEETQTPEQHQSEQMIDTAVNPQEIQAIPDMTFNRKFRRALLKRSGYVKMKNRLGYKDWFENLKNNIQVGKQMHTSNTEDVIRRSIEATDKRNEEFAKFLFDSGRSEEQVSEIIEKNMEIQEKISMKKIKS